MEQIPHLAMYSQEVKGMFEDAVPQHILPTVVRYLTDPNNQVSAQITTFILSV